MPIPGSILGSQIPVAPAVSVPDMYPSRANLRPVTNARDTGGQIKHTFADSANSAQLNLPCRLSPLIQIRPQDQEKQVGSDERAVALYQLNFASYINVAPQTLLTWQVKVDGVIYQIKAVESDGNKLTTRFEVSSVNQFEA